MALETFLISIGVMIVGFLMFINFDNKKKRKTWNNSHSVIAGAPNHINIKLGIEIAKLGGSITIICGSEYTDNDEKKASKRIKEHMKRGKNVCI